jgi:hypothetical protein
MDAYLAAIVDEARVVLGDNLVGAYIGGSLALDGYVPGRSDVDVAVVVRDALTDIQKHALVARLRHESLPCPARGLELVVYRLDVTRAGGTDPGFEMELNTGEQMDFRATYRAEDRPEQDGCFWYAVDRSILREHGRALLGPPALEVFGEVDGLLPVLADSVRWHLEHPGSDGVLNAHRALIRVRTGQWVSKVETARIVQEDVLRELSR